MDILLFLFLPTMKSEEASCIAINPAMRSQCLFVLWRCSLSHLFCRKKKPFLHGFEQLFVRHRFTEVYELRLIGLLLYRPCCSSFLPQVRRGIPACVHFTSFHRCPSSPSRSAAS